MQLGADEPDAARARDLQHVIFEGTALGSRFAVASGDEHRRADACALQARRVSMTAGRGTAMMARSTGEGRASTEG